MTYSVTVMFTIQYWKLLAFFFFLTLFTCYDRLQLKEKRVGGREKKREAGILYGNVTLKAKLQNKINIDFM